MKQLHVKLEYCYGIRRLEAIFDFDQYGQAFAVYAPNGMMKTSFAKTFRDLSSGEDSSDLIKPENVTVRHIKDENGSDISSDRVFVIEPYNEKYKSDKISTLLVNEQLRQKYDDIHQEIDQKAEALIAVIGKISGLKNEVKEEFSDAITHDRNDFYRALGRVRQEVEQEEDSPLADIAYSKIFNPKTVAILSDANFRNKIQEYIEKYDEIISKSTFFRKGVFTHNNAADIAKSLKQNGFFKAEHSVYLRINGEKKEISTENELEEAIESEKDLILTDDGLKTAFDEIDKLLNKNADLRQFRLALEQNQVIIPELSNPDKLRQNLWVAYLVRAKDSYYELVASYEKGKEEIAEIIQEARNQVTKWADVISIFNERFSVPFVVSMDNQEDVILKSDAPIIRFDFLDDPDNEDSVTVPIEEDNLLKVLSTGEKRALYILNIIFEVEARKESGQQTLFVVDDIADSFDYKNKYAIIEYLRDVAEEAIFQQIILSHNFDFHRTVSGRLDLKRKSRLLASKVNGAIILQHEIYQKSAPFKHWKQNLAEDSMLIASIPFLRNLAEFTGDDDSNEKLTTLLHYKTGTDAFTIQELQSLITTVLNDQEELVLSNPESKVKDLIFQVADSITADGTETAELEKKVVLSIAIRLKAEEFMVGKIDDAAFWSGIKKNQTIALIKRFKIDFSDERENIRLLERVNLMTPENIHLNSFMYEPILDLSPLHLKKLYTEVSGL